MPESWGRCSWLGTLSHPSQAEEISFPISFSFVHFCLTLPGIHCFSFFYVPNWILYIILKLLLSYCIVMVLMVYVTIFPWNFKLLKGRGSAFTYVSVVSRIMLNIFNSYLSNE